MKILNFGSLNLDYVYAVDHFVMPGETLDATEQTVNPGGKGLNQSVALAKAGAHVYHAGVIGTQGTLLKDVLEGSGVDTSFIRTLPVIQGNAVIQVTPQGENSILLFGGSNRCITHDHVESTLASFQKGDWLILQNEINDLPYIVDAAYEKGMHIVLNPSPYNDALAHVNFDRLQWLLINEVEAEQLSGSSDPHEAWRNIHERYPALSCVITLGKDGCAAFRVQDGSVEELTQAAYQVTAKDTTAAGDTFSGYFIASLMAGKPLSESIKRATAAAAISVTKAGAAASIPTAAEVEAYI